MRICPKRDAVCPHGMDCSYSIDQYECRDEPRNAALYPSPPSAQETDHAAGKEGGA